MSVKLIAIGNRMMRDDGAAILLAESLRPDMEGGGVEVVIAETDFQYALSKIDDGDFIIIIDASFYGREPGLVTVIPLESCLPRVNSNNSISMHGFNLLNMMGLYGIKFTGFVICIEGEKFEFGVELSIRLNKNFAGIKDKVKNEIYEGISKRG